MCRRCRSVHQQKPSAATAYANALARFKNDLSHGVSPSVVDELHILEAVQPARRGGKHPQGLLDAVAVGSGTVTLLRRGQLAPRCPVVVATYNAIARRDSAAPAV